MSTTGKLMFVAAQNGECNMDLFVYADDRLEAVRLWKRYYRDGIDCHNAVKVFVMPACRGATGAIEWTDMDNIEVNPRDVV